MTSLEIVETESVVAQFTSAAGYSIGLTATSGDTIHATASGTIGPEKHSVNLPGNQVTLLKRKHVRLYP